MHLNCRCQDLHAIRMQALSLNLLCHSARKRIVEKITDVFAVVPAANKVAEYNQEQSRRLLYFKFTSVVD